MSDLDALLADLEDSDEKPKKVSKPSASSSATKTSSAAPTIAKSSGSGSGSKTVVAAKEADYSDDLSSSEEKPKKAPVKKKYADSDSDDDRRTKTNSNQPPLNPDDLDDLIADIESQAGGLRAPRTAGLRVYGARKTTNRKQVKGALDGDDLDRIFDEISNSAKQKVSGDVDKLGFGVIDAERKFDLRAPKASAVFNTVECTLMVYTHTGEKTRIPAKHIEVKLIGQPGLKHVLEDKKDGTWSIRFKPESEGRVTLVIDGYGKRQFEWPIDIFTEVDPTQTTASTEEPLKVNTQCSATVIARDSRGKQLRIGGASFNLAFAGAGQLSQVGLADQMDGTYKLVFTPDTVGEYAIFITLDDKPIKTHPLQFKVAK